ncbi:4894_t:CDS:2 [Racocetra fulgida]|uniref:4894_t:CDS:1 n=1 Tax=Racocetra fulgida TaxID=60492 RepID=A0A9N9B0P1_9GLOM|nr:4894_t:CDS:2 [Racocetra fulgida]
MSSNVSSASDATSNLPTVEQVKEWSRDVVKAFLQGNKTRLDLDDSDIDKIYTQRVRGSTFLDFTAVDYERWGIPGSPAKEIEKLINKIKGGIDTETEKGKRVITHSAEMDFPLQLTQIRRRNSHGKFQKPPNLSGAKPSEDEIQEYFIDECTALKSLPEIQLYVGDTYSTPLLDTRKPDFVFVQKGRPLDPLNVVAVGEIRKRTGNHFKNADIGHAVAFGEKVLQLQPRRQHVYALGWIEPSINLDGTIVTLVRSISSGRTSIVYEGILENSESSVVVKKAKNEEYLSCFINEKNALTRLSDLNSPYLPKLLLSNDDTLVMTPLCTKINNLQIEDIENIVETLKIVHSNFQLVHMDLRKYNLLRDDAGNILITDWGYSKTQGENSPFAGALECMPDNVLRSLLNDEQINYDPTIDLILQDILDFWAVNGKSEWWNTISSDAKNLNYVKLLEDIKKLF